MAKKSAGPAQRRFGRPLWGNIGGRTAQWALQCALSAPLAASCAPFSGVVATASSDTLRKAHP
eukprot:11883718-Alexandrium_andersonii.AAC.1